MCSIGEHLGGNCSPSIETKENFSTDEWKLLKLRSGRSGLRNVCHTHKLAYLNLYESRQTLCCNPLPNRHVLKPCKGTKTISLSLYRKAKGTFPLVPGKKLCVACFRAVWDLVGGEEELQSSQSLDPTPDNSQEVGQGQEPSVGGEQKEVNVQEVGQGHEGVAGEGCNEAAVIEPEAINLQERSDVINQKNVPVVGFNLMGSPSVPARLRPRTTKPAEPKHSSPSSVGTSTTRTSSSSSPGFVPFEEALSALNSALRKLACSAVDKDRLKSRATYGSLKLEEIVSCIHEFLQENAGENQVLVPFKEDSDNFDEVLKLLKVKFNSATSISDKVLVLSALPPSWSVGRIQEEFGSDVTNYTIRLTKKLVKENGVLVTPGQKQGRPISDATVKAVLAFYELDEISSKLMPGCKDYVSVVEDGKRVQKQKRLLLSNLDSLYEAYITSHSKENHLSFSKFAKLRPKHCVLSGSPGTHSVCVCIYHETVNLMFEGARFKEASTNEEKPLQTFKDCLDELICEEKRPECYLRQCKQCPSSNELKLKLKRLLSESMLTSVAYRGWFKVGGRYHLEKVIKPADEFLENFMELLFKLLPHHFITKQQSAHYQKIKQELKEGEALVICDFAENYSCVMRNEIQGYHWTNEQITIHPFVAYYKVNSELKSVSYAAVTDHKKHSTTTFHSFQKKFVPFLVKKMAEDNIECKKLFYFSDGASAQYKNRKNIQNICLHENDFGIKVEWHFFASCHGKGPCDGVGGCLKRCAARASLQGTLIRNAREFCEWAKNLPNITTEIVSIEEIEEDLQQQVERAKDVLNITGIASYHSATPDSESSIVLKRYSASPNQVTMPLFKRRFFVPWESLQDHVLVVRQNEWCVAQILSKNNDTKDLTVKFMTPSGRQKAYTWPAIADEATIHWRYVLATTVPVQRKGRGQNFTVPVLDKNKADRELKLYQEMGGTGQPPLEAEDEDDPDDPDNANEDDDE